MSGVTILDALALSAYVVSMLLAETWRERTAWACCLLVSLAYNIHRITDHLK